MILCISTESLSIIIYNFTVSLSLLAGAYWTFFIYSKRHEDVGLDVKIDRIESNSFTSKSDEYLDINVTIKNTGKRDVNLQLSKADIKILKAEHNGTFINDPIDTKTGITSTEKRYNGRLRSGVNIKLTYWLKIDTTGLYFIEFKIPIEMSKYYCWFSICKKKEVIEWSDRTYYLVK